jgi:hypothetical protein
MGIPYQIIAFERFPLKKLLSFDGRRAVNATGSAKGVRASEESPALRRNPDFKSARVELNSSFMSAMELTISIHALGLFFHQ